MNQLTVPLTDKPSVPFKHSIPRRRRRLYVVDEPARPNSIPKSGSEWAKSYRWRLFVTDQAIIVIVVALGFIARLLMEPALVSLARSLAYFTTGGILVISLWSLTLVAFRTRETHVVGVGPDEYKRVLTATLTFFGVLAIIFVVGGTESARWFFIVAAPLGPISLILDRWLWRKWLFRQRAYGHFLSRVIVVGKRRDVLKVVRQIERMSGAAYSVVAAVVDKPGTSPEEAAIGGVPVLIGSERVVEYATDLGCDGIVVAGGIGGRTEYIHDLAWALEGKSLELILATSLANVAGPRIHYRPVDGLPLLQVEIPQFDGGKHALKRIMDITLSGFALIVLLPALAIIAVMVRADSPGPALFSQERVGQNGRRFRMYKFRSMSVDAPERLAELRAANEGSGLLFKMKNDPRVTRLGRVLRKYSLDELPQIWNVLVGDMSLVGPRPPLEDEVENYEDHVRRRLYIKPGLTGMWQVGGRSALSWEESVRLDLYYVENWSVVGDLMIIWRTFRVLIAPVGAY